MRLFRTIGFRSKAAIIALSFAPPMGALAWQHFNSRAGQIEFSAREREGVNYARALMPMLAHPPSRRTPPTSMRC